MNAVEIADAVAELFSQPFDGQEFPFTFLEAFGNKEVTIKRLRKGDSNLSDLPSGVLQKSNIHIAVCPVGEVGETLTKLRASPKNAAHKVKFVLATDGETVAAEDLRTGEPLECEFRDMPAHFGFFLELGGISTVKEIKDNPIDIRATGWLNKLYLELLRENPDWQKPERRPDLNHFFARLIFCFFAEDTGIFHGDAMFTETLTRMTESSGSNVHQVLDKLFAAMNVPTAERQSSDLPLWALTFPYVNGGLFGDNLEIPRFSRIARSYLLRAGELDWRTINPDIFGSMIQAVADDEERGALGMHYTSVPNILKVLNPLFLDNLRSQLEAAGDNPIKLLNLRKRMARIRVFDPACGSGNFLVIAYKEMRAIEAEVNRRRCETNRATDIPLTNFRGIELRDFAAEVARLALIISEYQADVLYRGSRLALADFLPLQKDNWIWKGNALRVDWATVCPPTGIGVKVHADNLFEDPLDQIEIDFANAGGETFICGNPPYLGSKWQSQEHKADLQAVFGGRGEGWKSLDYVSGWFLKAVDYGIEAQAASAFVATNSICQGQQVPLLWPLILKTGHRIFFAHTSFKWSNLAANNAGVIVVIVGISRDTTIERKLFSEGPSGTVVARTAQNINPYLVPGPDVIVEQRRQPDPILSPMLFGNMPRDGGHFVLSGEQRRSLIAEFPDLARFVRPYIGSEEMIQGKARWCIWIKPDDAEIAESHPGLKPILQRVREFRERSDASSTREFATRPYRFVQIAGTALKYSIAVAKVSSERRPYLPAQLFSQDVIISDLLFALYDAPLWNFALVTSRLHLVWIAAVCGKLKTDFRYSNTLGWNTFPVPNLTASDKERLTLCAEEILLAREAHYPATLGELYSEEMPEHLKRAHFRNDDTVERIYLGRRFKNDTERLEKLFELYNGRIALR